MTGLLAQGEQLPSVRNLAGELGINPNTVRKAYQDLEREGVIYSVPGKGSFLGDTKGFSGQIQEQHLGKIGQLVSQAKSLGISLEHVVESVRKIYEN